MLHFIKSQPEVVPKLLLHMSTSSIMDLLLKIISMEESPEGKGTVQVTNNPVEENVTKAHHTVFCCNCLRAHDTPTTRKSKEYKRGGGEKWILIISLTSFTVLEHH